MKILFVFLLTGLVSSQDETADNSILPTSEIKSHIKTLLQDDNFKEKKFAANFLQPISDAVTNFVLLTKHPNYGGFQLLNPLNLWQKLHEKSPGYFTGPYGATFGLAANGPLDYPFAFRKTAK